MTFAVYYCDGPSIAADSFADRKGEGWYGDTSLSLATAMPLDDANVEELRKRVEERINALVERKYSHFIEIVSEACSDLDEVVGHSSYVPS